MGKDEQKSEFQKFDGRLRDAVTDDMAAYVGEVMSSVAFRGGLRGIHSVRTVQELSSFGWSEVRYPYRRGADDARRCKQAGMHWRHHNAACVCAIIAKIRSAA